MLRKRKATERGRTKLDWLDSKHSFSFGNYYDPQFTSFSCLRVMNDDIIAPGGGFGTHPHRDMEIVTYVFEGQLEHKDSRGNIGVIQPGEVQRMSAGTGIMHSEYNHSPDNPVHLYQIWLTPEQNGIEPGYEQQRIPIHEQPNRLHLIASSDARDGSLRIYQQAELRAGRFDAGQQYHLDIADGRQAWIQIVSGTASVNDIKLETGDGLAVSDERTLQITADKAHEILIFDLP